MNLRQRTWEIVETGQADDVPSRLFDAVIITLILSSTAVIILDSVPGLLAQYRTQVIWFEYFVVAVFTVEYLVRLWACTADPRYAQPFRGRLRYATTPLALVDLVAVLPFYLPWFLPRGLLFLRVLRLVRLLRLFKFSRYSSAPQLVVRALRRRRGELLAALFVLLLLLVSMASLLYLAENPERPDLYSSIPEAMWWSILALTGNGQVAPITFAGRIIASLIAIIGVGLFALPAGLLASAFTEELGAPQEADQGLGDPDVERVTRRIALAHAERMRERLDQQDYATDYDPSAVVLTDEGRYQGQEAVVAAALELREVLSGDSWRLGTLQVAGRAALLGWQGEDPRGYPASISETLLVRDGLIELHVIDRSAATDEVLLPAGG